MDNARTGAIPKGIDKGGIGAILPSDISRVGFGCAALLGTMSAGDSERLLCAALEAGISYFDTARMYGSGGAEAVLGRITPRRRSRMILVSKAGIMPPSRSLPIRAAKKAVGFGLQAFPLIQKKFMDTPPFGARLGVFDLPSLNTSLNTSLKELRTDYLDILLLHEVESTQTHASVVEWLHDMKQVGKIRSFGIASDVPNTLRIISETPALTDIVQFASSAWEQNVSKVSDRATRLVVTHSCLGRRFHELHRWLTAHSEVAQRWSSQLDIEARDAAALARLFLADSLISNPNGIVLFSSRKAEHVSINAELGRMPLSDLKRDTRLTELLNELPCNAVN